MFNGVTNQFYSTRLPFREDCLSHETYPEPVEVPLGHDRSVAELFASARETLAGPLTLASNAISSSRSNAPGAAGGSMSSDRGAVSDCPRPSVRTVRSRADPR